MNISEIWRVIWPEGQENLFHQVIAIIFVVALTVEVILYVKYRCKCEDNQNAIKELKSGNTLNKNTEKWIKNYLETDEEDQPIKNNKKKYLLTRYPEILSYSTRSNLHFVCTLYTAIGVLGTFYGIQSGLSDIDKCLCKINYLFLKRHKSIL